MTTYTKFERNLAWQICAIAASHAEPIKGKKGKVTFVAANINYGAVLDELLGYEGEAGAVGPRIQRANFLAIYALDHVRGLHNVKMTRVKPRHHAEAAQLLLEGWTDV